MLGYITFFTGDFKSSEIARLAAAARLDGPRRRPGASTPTSRSGFVRAEVVPIDDLIALGSFHAANDKGVLRVEGKDYIVKDGDVMNFRHTA